MRYALAPSLISAGRTNQLHGLPLAARCDLFWPEHTPAARRNDQYISTFADALVAPLGETETTRSVWLPPGEWCASEIISALNSRAHFCKSDLKIR